MSTSEISCGLRSTDHLWVRIYEGDALVAVACSNCGITVEEFLTGSYEKNFGSARASRSPEDEDRIAAAENEGMIHVHSDGTADDDTDCEAFND